MSLGVAASGSRNAASSSSPVSMKAPARRRACFHCFRLDAQFCPRPRSPESRAHPVGQPLPRVTSTRSPKAPSFLVAKRNASRCSAERYSVLCRTLLRVRPMPADRARQAPLRDTRRFHLFQLAFDFRFRHRGTKPHQRTRIRSYPEDSGSCAERFTVSSRRLLTQAGLSLHG